MSLEQMQEELERYYINMENELLLNIAKKLSANKPMEIDKWDEKNNQPLEGSGGVNEWQLERLKEIGGLTSENAEIIAKYSGKTINDVEKIFARAREIGTEIDEEQIKLGIKAGVLNEVNPTYENTIIKEIANVGSKNTLVTLNQVNNSLLASAGNEYRKIVNETYYGVISGTKTRQVAMQQAVSKLAEKGLTSFIAVNGAEWKSESYVNMVIRANTNNTINDIVEERAKIRGANYYEISSHLGARPLCSQDQGQIFSIDGSTSDIVDGEGKTLKVRPWSDSTYGKPAGILGINCRHSRHIFIPGFSIYDQEPIDEKENEEIYKEEQQQRAYERQMRNKKREIEMLKSTGAEENYIKNKQNQLKNFSSQYNDWLDETGRRRNYANEWVGTINIKSNKDNSKSIVNFLSKEINKNKTPIKLEIGDLFKFNNQEYKVDNKNIKYELKSKELEFATWLSQRTTKKVILNPKINNPEGIKVPDLKIANEYYDMKIITGGSQQVIYHNVYKKEEQSENFLFETTKSPLSMENLQNQVLNVFNRKDTNYVKKIGIKKGEEFIILENKKKK